MRLVLPLTAVPSDSTTIISATAVRLRLFLLRLLLLLLVYLLCSHRLLVVHCWSPRAHLHVVGMLWFMSDINQPNLPTPFLFCSCVYFCPYGPFDCISFHKFSQQLSVFRLCSSGLISALLVLSTIYLFVKVFFSPDIIPSGLTGPKTPIN